jgi:hypothetical protein
MIIYVLIDVQMMVGTELHSLHDATYRAYVMSEAPFPHRNLKESEVYIA